jgi:hypothetical protein
VNESEQFGHLVTYIKQHISQGIAEDNIRHVLLQYHWDAESVEQAFSAAKAMPPAPLPIHAAPQKYKVFRAIGDTFRAIRKNPITFLLSAVLSCTIAVVSLILVSTIMDKALYGDLSPLFASTSKQLTVLLGSLVVYTLWYGLSSAFVLAATSQALYEGSEGRRSSIRTTLSQSFARLGRVVTANILLSLIVFWPAAIIISLPVILTFSGSAGVTLSLVLLPICMLIALVWACLTLVKFAVAPYVALFEPRVSITRTLGRSAQLLSKGGQWFLVKGFLLTLLITLVIAAATGQTPQDLSNSSNAVSSILLTALSILVNGAMVMLYRNRKIVRG